MSYFDFFVIKYVRFPEISEGALRIGSRCHVREDFRESEIYRGFSEIDITNYLH
jgi:hypothetical protein